MDNPWLLWPTLLVVDSLHYVFARLLLPHLPPEVSGFYIMVLAAVEVACFTRGRLRLDLFRRHLVFFLAIGFLVGGSTYMSMLSVKFIDPGTASLLSRAGVVFGVALGVLWLGERLDRVQSVGAGLSMVGVFVVAFRPGHYLRLGALLSLGSTLMYALHAALVKRYGGGMPFAIFLLYRIVGTGLCLGLIVAVAHGTTWGAWLATGPNLTVGPAGLGLVLLTATVDVVFSRALYYLALRRLDMSLHTIILTLSPVVTMLWSFALFGSVPSLREVLGGLAVLAGVALVTGRPARGA